MKYPDVPSAIKPVPHGPAVPVRNPPKDLFEFEFLSSTDTDESTEDLWNQHSSSKQPKLLSQAQLNDLTRDLYLSKESAQLLGSRLRENNLLAPETTFYWYRNRDEKFRKFFTLDEQYSLVYCNDIDGLVKELGLEYKAAEWRLFLDSSFRSMKAVLLHIGNKLASIPIAYSVNMKETYLDMKYLLQALKYDLHTWKICGDLKMMAILLGLQAGYTKYPCFLCLWDSRADDRHYFQKKWPARDKLTPGECNVKSSPLVDPKNVLLPPLHIKLGLMKNFVKALNKDDQSFRFLQTKFPAISDAKLRAGVFNGPQIRELMKDSTFDKTLNELEKLAWESLKSVSTEFLGNKRSQNYEELVSMLMQNFQALGARMSTKMHFLNSHLDYFPKNCGDYSEEQGERFHRDIRMMEERYQGRWDINMLADYCWCLKRDIPILQKQQHKRKALKRSFINI